MDSKVARIDVAVVSEPATLISLSTDFTDFGYFFSEITHKEIDISVSASLGVRPCLMNDPSMSFLTLAAGAKRSSTTFRDIYQLLVLVEV